MVDKYNKYGNHVFLILYVIVVSGLNFWNPIPPKIKLKKIKPFILWIDGLNGFYEIFDSLVHLCR